MNNHQTAVLTSGGLDSVALLADLAAQGLPVTPVYVRQGLQWETMELYWLRRFLKKYRRANLRRLVILDLPMNDVYQKHWSTGAARVPGARTKDAAVYLPGRNVVLTVKTAIYCALQGIQTIALGSLGHNPFSDATPPFFKQLAATLSTALSHPLTIIAPYRQWSKVQVIRRNQAAPLHLSFSCLDPRGRHHCGQCNKCAERRTAFRVAGVVDRTVYKLPPPLRERIEVGGEPFTTRPPIPTFPHKGGRRKK